MPALPTCPKTFSLRFHSPSETFGNENGGVR
jgi:hypothetical protein